MKRPSPARVRRAGPELGAQLTAWRKLLGLTAEDAAARAGVSRSTVQRLEHGELGVSVEALLNVLRVYGRLEALINALDPYETDLGRARADQLLPRRVRS